jgi:hypothetical protein
MHHDRHAEAGQVRPIRSSRVHASNEASGNAPSNSRTASPGLRREDRAEAARLNRTVLMAIAELLFRACGRQRTTGRNGPQTEPRPSGLTDPQEQLTQHHPPS